MGFKGLHTTLRLAAWRALEKRANGGIIAAQGAFEIQIGLSDEHPAIRSAAANILAMNPETALALRACLSDPDALVRAIAVRNCATTDEATAALQDAASVVRAVALDRILTTNDSTVTKSLFEALSKPERINTLAGACSRSDTILSLCFKALSESDVTPRQTHILLEASAQSSPSVAKIAGNLTMPSDELNHRNRGFQTIVFECQVTFHSTALLHLELANVEI